MRNREAIANGVSYGAVADFADITEVKVGLTRGRKAIDRIFVNIIRSVSKCGTLAPLETERTEEEESRDSDHQIAYCKVELARKEMSRWATYSYRHSNQESVDKFQSWTT